MFVSLDMTSKHFLKKTTGDSARSDWNSVAAHGALNSPQFHVPRSPLRSPTICRADPMGCTSPHMSPDVKAVDSGDRNSPIPSHLTLDRKAHVSDKASCDGGGSLEESLHSSGFLTPPSRNSSLSHSDHVGARARLPPPMSTPPGTPGKKVVTETPEKRHWLRYPKLRLSDYQLKSYLWLPVTKEDPRPAHVESRRPSSFAGNKKKHRNKSVSFSFGDVKQSIDRMRSMPVTPSISRRWSSTGLDQAITRGRSVSENYVVPDRRRTIPFTDRGAEALTAIKERLTRRDIYAHQMETPTIITLRRASAVLGTVAQRQSSMTGDPPSTLPDKWEQACNEVPLAAYLITADEIHTLAALIRRTFADGTPQESSKALEGVSEDERKPKKKRTRFGSLVNLGKDIQERKFPANVAITVADVHSISRTSTMSRKGTFMSQMSRKTSIVSTILARKSVHEIIWEDDGTPQSLRSSTWNLSHDPLKNNIATWSSDSFRRESGQSGISITAKQKATPPSSGSGSPGKKSGKPPTFRPVFTTPSKLKKKFESKYSHPPHWKKGSIQELPFPGVLPQADDGAMPASMPIPIDDVVSFPPLPQRQHTSDWQIPPTDINTPVETPADEIPNIFLRHPSVTHSMHLWLGDEDSEEDENKLYRYGIDATIAPKVSRISATAPTTPNPTIKTTLWGSDAPSKNGKQQQRRRSSAMPQPNILKKELSNSRLAPIMGSKVGASSGARRRSSTRVDHIRIVTAQIEHEDGRPPWRKVRKDSGYPGVAAPPSSDEGSDVSGSGEEEEQESERAKLLDTKKGRGKVGGMTGMVLQLPSTIRKMRRTGSTASLKSMGGTRGTEGTEDEVEKERKRRMQEKARGPSPTKKTFQVTFPKRPPASGTPKLRCSGANCTRNSCDKTHSRAPSFQSFQPPSPVKRKVSSDGSTFSLERTKTGTYVWGSGKGDEQAKKA